VPADNGVPSSFWQRAGRTRICGGAGGSVAPQSGVPLNLQMNETRILIRLLQMYIPRNWEFGLALAKLRNFRRGGGDPPPARYTTAC
jgi:hypothetical protein